MKIWDAPWCPARKAIMLTRQKSAVGRARARPGKTCSRGDARQMNEQPNDATTHTTQNMGLDELPQFADTPQGDVPPEPMSPEAKAAAKRRSNRQFVAILVAMSVMLEIGRAHV